MSDLTRTQLHPRCRVSRVTTMTTGACQKCPHTWCACLFVNGKRSPSERWSFARKKEKSLPFRMPIFVSFALSISSLFLFFTIFCPRKTEWQRTTCVLSLLILTCICLQNNACFFLLFARCVLVLSLDRYLQNIHYDFIRARERERKRGRIKLNISLSLSLTRMILSRAEKRKEQDSVCLIRGLMARDVSCTHEN